MEGKDKAETTEKKPKEKRIRRRILKCFFGFLVSIFVLSAVWSLIDQWTGYNFPFFGLRASVVSTPSMSLVHPDNEERLEGIDDQLQVNDLIFTLTVDDLDDLKINDVVTFVSDEGILICHRIVEIHHEDGMIWTQGDANNVRDGVIGIDDVKGKVIGSIPGVGVVTLYLNSAYGLLGISLAFSIVFGAYLYLEISGNKKEKKDGESKGKGE